MNEIPSEMKKRNLLATRAANTFRFSSMNLFIIFCTVMFAIGGWVNWLGLVMTFVMIGFIEEAVGDADEREDMPPQWYMNLMLRLTLPLLVIATFVCLNTVGPGNPIVDAAMRTIGFDPELARARTDSSFYYFGQGGLVSLGMLYGLGGINVAHELVHRLHSRHDQNIGKGLLSFSWDTGFAIEHVYGHHRHVGTELDPATARRGEYIWFFVVRSTIGQVIGAYKIEKERLKRKGEADRIYNNRFWQGQMITVGVLIIYVYMCGPIGILFSLYSGSIGKIYLEVTNFIEHYGLVRVPGTRVEPRHSWDSYRRVSSGLTYNLPLHSFHHRFATRPFWELEHSKSEAPMLPRGYMPMIFTAFLPGYWKKVSEELLKNWDDNYASDEERAYLMEKGIFLGTPREGENRAT